MESTTIPAVPVPSGLSSTSLGHLILASGPLGLLAWAGIATVIISAIVVVVRHIINPHCHRHGTYFFQIAHVAFLLVINHIGVGGLIGICCPPFSYWMFTMFRSLAIGIGTLVVCGAIVSAVTRHIPKPSLWPLLGCGAAVTSLVVIVVSFLMMGLEW